MERVKMLFVTFEFNGYEDGVGVKYNDMYDLEYNLLIACRVARLEGLNVSSEDIKSFEIDNGDELPPEISERDLQILLESGWVIHDEAENRRSKFKVIEGGKY